MKRVVSLIVAFVLCLSLCACGDTTAKSNPPAESTLPQVPTEADSVPTEAPTETPTEAPTEAPTEPPVTEPVITDCKFKQKAKTIDYYIFKEPDHSAKIAKVLPIGTYTIVQETYDAYGHHWGKLKSGSGWICLTEIQDQIVPVEIISASKAFLSGGEYTQHGNVNGKYTIAVRMQAFEDLTDIAVYEVDHLTDKTVGSPIVKLEALKADGNIVVWLEFPMDFDTYEFQFTNEFGIRYKYQITDNLSGEGELIGSWVVK